MMRPRTEQEENSLAIAQRRSKIAELKGHFKKAEEKHQDTWEEKYRAAALQPASTPAESLEDEDLKYDEIRTSKWTKTELKLDTNISQQQAQQQQQQQQQQMQVSQNQQTHDLSEKKYDVYKGYQNLISVQSYDHGLKSDLKALDKLKDEFGSTLTCLKESTGRGLHDSQLGSIGYVTIEAARKLAPNLKQLKSGICLHRLPEGFQLLVTEGERHLPLRSETSKEVDKYGQLKTRSYDKREFPRLVLHYNKDLKNKSTHPLTPQLIPPPDRIKVIGTPAQFNVAGGKELFKHFEHMAPQPDYAYEDTKNELYDFIRAKDKARGNDIIKRLGYFIEYEACYNVDFKYKILRPENYVTGMTLDDVERNLKRIRAECSADAMEERNVLYQFMRGENKDAAEALIAKYKELFELFDPNDIAGMWDIFYTSGLEGLSIILEKLQNLYLFDGRAFHVFKKTFLEYSPNWSEFLEYDAQTTIDKISTLSPKELKWWHELSTAHIRICGWANLPDLFNAFEYFLNEFRRIGREKMGPDHYIELPEIVPFAVVGNMKVVLDRVLIILSNARNFKEQVDHLYGLNFNTNDIVYASTPQKFSLITSHMNVHQYKTDAFEIRMRENLEADSDLKMSYEEIEKDLDRIPIFPHLYRFLGTQSYSAPYDDYLELFKDLSNPWCHQKLATLDVNTRNRIAFVLTATTTNQRGHQCNLKKQFNTLLDLKYHESKTTAEVMRKLVNLVTAARWINLDEIVVITKIFFRITPDQQKFLHEIIVEHKEEYLKHLAIYDKNPKSLEPKTYITALQILKEEKEDEQLKLKLPRLFSIINSKDFYLDHVSELISSLKSFERINGKHAYNQLVDILSILYIKDESLPSPNIEDVLRAIRSLGKIEGASIKQHIARHLPPNCTYSPADSRTAIPPPLGKGNIIKGLLSIARKEGVTLDIKQLNSDECLSYLVLKSKENDKYSKKGAKTAWCSIAEEHVILLQKQRLGEYEKEINTDLDERDKHVLNEIIYEIFAPGPFKTIEETLIPMKEYGDQVRLFVDALKKIKAKWPNDFSNLLGWICGDPSDTKVSRSLAFMNDFLCQIADHFSGKIPFPDDFFTLMVAHEKKYGVEPKLLVTAQILGAKGISRENKMRLLKLNLAAAANKINASSFIVDLLKYHQPFASVFPQLLTILETYASTTSESALSLSLYNEKCELVFKSTQQLLKVLDHINNAKLTEKLFSLLIKHPESYLNIVQSIIHIPVPAEKEEIFTPIPDPIVAPKDATTNVMSATEKHIPQKILNAQHIITQLIFECCDSSEFNENEIVKAIKELAKEDLSTLQALTDMRPSPTFKTIKKILSYKGSQAFLRDPTDPEFGYRILRNHFNTSRVVSAIEGMRNLRTGRKLLYTQRRKLLSQMLLMNRFGYHSQYPVYIRGSKELTVKDLNQAEFPILVQRCRAIFQSATSTSEEKENARLIFNALVREAIWQVTRKFPFSTQVLAALRPFLHNESSISEIDTGEGKSIIMAMMAANLWFEKGGSVNVCTSNMELARESFEQFSPVFDLLGIPRNGKLVTSQTSVSEYCYDGINYSDAAQLSLFLAKQKKDEYYLKYHQKTPMSLALDEADYTFFDDTTHYRYATILHKTDLHWIFDLLYKFIRSPEFMSPKATIRDDIKKAREILISGAKQRLDKDPKIEEYVAKISDRQIDTWLESGIAASRLIERKHFIVRTESRGQDDDAFHVSFARILANSRVSESAEWSNGVHQFLHARLNEERETKQRRIPHFPIDPETAPIASMSSQNVIDHHLERGRVLGVTGTAGSKDEINELAERKMSAYRIPPHNENKRQDLPDVIANHEHDQFEKIIDAILRHLRQKEPLGLLGYETDKKPQPILVAFNDIETSQRFYEFLRSRINTPKFSQYKDLMRTQLLNGSKTLMNGKEGLYSEAEIVSKAGVAGCITVSTMLERGTDIKPRESEDDVEQNHRSGLFVIQGFIGHERLTRQIRGRAARWGHVGQTQLIVNQQEFTNLLKSDANPQAVENIGMLQAHRAKLDKDNRRFAERLGYVKNYFFSRYIEFIQDETNITPNLTHQWATCLNNMDIEWRRLVSEGRSLVLEGKQSEREMLENCTTHLISNTCAHWNMMVPYDTSPVDEVAKEPEKQVAHVPDEKNPHPAAAGVDANVPDRKELEKAPETNIDLPIAKKRNYSLKPGVVEDFITQLSTRTIPPDVTEEDEGFPLEFNDVSPARAYVENCPLEIMTAPTAMIEKKKMLDWHQLASQILRTNLKGAAVQHRVEKKRATAAIECIGQILNTTLDTRNLDQSLRSAFNNLIQDAFSANTQTPFRKKILEIFAIAEWSKMKSLKKKISETLLRSLFNFAVDQVHQYKVEIPTLVIAKKSSPKQCQTQTEPQRKEGVESLSPGPETVSPEGSGAESNSVESIESEPQCKEVTEIEALLTFLKSTLNLKLAQRQQEKEQMTNLESAVDTVKTTLSALFYDDCPTTLEKLIHLIDHPFTRGQTALQSALKEAETRHEFAKSWCVKFSADVNSNLTDAKESKQPLALVSDYPVQSPEFIKERPEIIRHNELKVALTDDFLEDERGYVFL